MGWRVRKPHPFSDVRWRWVAARFFSQTVSLRSEIVKAVRAACGPDFIIVYRLSMLDLVKDGSTWPEIVQLGKAIEAAGATIINTLVA